MNLSEAYKKRILELAGVVLARENNEPDWLNEIGMNDIDIPKEYVHDELNQSIWKGDNLDAEVRERLLEIAMEFYKNLEIDAEIMDIKLVGSMANYNWSEHSDIDIHMFFNLSDIAEDTVFAKEYLDAKKKIWNDKHKIMIRGHEVELYAQDISDKYYGGGVYSILKGDWEIRPKMEKVEIDRSALRAKIKSIADKIEVVEKLSAVKKPEEVYEVASRIKEKIGEMRKCGLQKEGEFSLENLAFKYLRNNGYIGRIIDVTKNMYDKKMSID
jgi:predicted nucleotidyltransferase